MKQVFLTADDRVVVLDVPAPVCPDGGVLVETLASLVSTGTEVAALKEARETDGLESLVRAGSLAVKGLRRLAQIGVRRTWRAMESLSAPADAPGYSLAGRVLAVGRGVDDFNVGDLVACGGSGFAAHAEIAAVPKNLCVRVPAGLDPRQACFATVGAIALQGVRRAEVGLGETVVVVGLGLVGLLTVQL
ncbi:MAG: oxidoreductase, partial [Myxococcales bacterium]